MTPRLLIVDDEAPARNRLKMLLADIAADCPHELVGEAGNAQQALDAIAAVRPDVLLLDIQMPVTTGIDLAEQLARRPDAPAIVFITAFDQHALKAFDVQAVDYLLKPVRAARLAEAIRRAAHRHAQGFSQFGSQSTPLASTRRHFSIQVRGRVLLVPVAEVLYCKAELKYVTLRTRNQEYLVEEALTAIEEEFGAHFVRIHRNALVARDAIIGVERGSQHVDGDDGEKVQESWQVILHEVDERLPISRRQWSVVKALVR